MSLYDPIKPRNKIDVNVVVFGDAEVGKTSLIHQYAHSQFTENYKPTVGVDFNSRLVQTEGKLVRAHIWDTSGKNCFVWSAQKHIQEADGFVFVYDVTNENSLENLSEWLDQVQRYAKAPNLPKMLVGNKSDLRHKQTVGASIAKEWGIPEGMIHIEVSAKTGKYLNVVFYILTTEILRYRSMGTVVPLGVLSEPQFSILPRATQEANLAEEALYESKSAVEDGPEYQHLFKIMIVGSPRVGKTCIRYRFCKNHYSKEYNPTAGFDFSTRTLMIDGEKVKVQVWDVSGDPLYEATRKGYCKGANGFILVYDSTDPDSFTSAEYLLKELDMCGCDKAAKILVGNKVDQNHNKKVTFTTGKDFADGWRIPYLETSARYGTNVDLAFTRLLVAIKRKNAPWKKIYNFA